MSLALPPQKCCTEGHRHNEISTGTLGRIGDVETYIAYPKDKSVKQGILYLTDGFGPRFPNNQMLADEFAAEGFFVVMPDLFHGDPIPQDMPKDFDISGWRSRHEIGQIDPIIESVLDAMRSEFGCEKIGAVGYCLGAKYTVRFLRPSQRQLKAGFMAHPTWLEFEEVEQMRAPLSIACAENDETFPPEKRHECEKLLQQLGEHYELRLFGQVNHGFTSRGDPSNIIVEFAKGQAFIQAVNWLKLHLS